MRKYETTDTFREYKQIKKRYAMKTLNNLGLEYWHVDKMFPRKRLNLTWMETQTTK